MKSVSNPADIKHQLNGALLINKPEGVSSFGVIREIQRCLSLSHLKRNQMPKLGHGGTLDPFATGVLVILCGRAVKLARYFLGSAKVYEGVIRFGETTIPGDPTAPVSERSEIIPSSLQELQDLATRLTRQPYLQTPPMHSAKKLNGKPLYELARKGLEVERESKLCHLYEFEILSYEAPRARFRVKCSSGTYVRTLAQDFAKLLGTVGMLDSLCRTSSGIFELSQTAQVEELSRATEQGIPFHELSAWIPFDQLLDGYPRAEATAEESESLKQGRQNILFNILKRVSDSPKSGTESKDCVAIYHSSALVAIARKDQQNWGIERVFAD